MNELLNDLLAQQRYADDLARAEQAYDRQTALNAGTSPTRTRLALGLVTLATKLQPTLAIHVQRQAPTAVARASAPIQTALIPSIGRLCIEQEQR